MARPLKQGLDYFPLDTGLDTKFALIEAEFGIAAFGVVVKLYQKIYGGYGYYLEWTREVALLFAREVGLGGNAVSEIVSASIREGIFNREKYEKYQILTSAGIQKRYFEAASRRLGIKVDNRYLLICVTYNVEYVDNNRVNVDNNHINASRNTQIKVNNYNSNNSYISYLYAPTEYGKIYHMETEDIPDILNRVGILFVKYFGTQASKAEVESILFRVLTDGQIDEDKYDDVEYAFEQASFSGNKNLSYVGGVLRKLKLERK